MTTEEQLDYLAGFFDADGSVHSRSTGKRQGISFAITQATPTVPQMFKERFGGNVALITRKNPNWRNSWLWSRGCTRASCFIDDMAGRLVIRSDQLSVASQFLKSIRIGTDRRGIAVAPITVSYREGLLQTLSDLNHRNVNDNNTSVGEQSDAYWAGLFDGDGSVGAAKDAQSRVHRPVVQIFSGYEPILLAAQAQFGGGNIHRNLNGKRCHRWVAYYKTAEKFLWCVRPFLIEKKERVEIALRVSDLIRNSQKILVRKKRHAVWMFTDSVIEKIDSLKQEMLVLNRRGPMRGIPFVEEGVCL